MSTSIPLTVTQSRRASVRAGIASRHAYRMYATVTLAVMLVGAVYSGPGGWLVIGGGILAAAAPYAIVLARGDWANPLVLYSPFLALRGWGVLLTGLGLISVRIPFFGWMETETVRALMEKAIAVEIIGVFALYSGYQTVRLLRGSGKSAFNLPLVKNVGIAAAIVVGIAWYSTSVVVSSAGSVSAMIEGMAGRRELYAGAGYYAKLSQWGIIGALLLVHAGNIKMSIFVLVGQVSVAMAMGDRGNVIFYSIIPYVVFWHYTVSRISIRKLLLPTLAVLVFFQLFGE